LFLAGHAIHRDAAEPLHARHPVPSQAVPKGFDRGYGLALIAVASALFLSLAGSLRLCRQTRTVARSANGSALAARRGRLTRPTAAEVVDRYAEVRPRDVEIVPQDRTGKRSRTGARCDCVPVAEDVEPGVQVAGLGPARTGANSVVASTGVDGGVQIAAWSTCGQNVPSAEYVEGHDLVVPKNPTSEFD